MSGGPWYVMAEAELERNRDSLVCCCEFQHQRADSGMSGGPMYVMAEAELERNRDSLVCCCEFQHQRADSGQWNVRWTQVCDG